MTLVASCYKEKRKKTKELNVFFYRITKWKSREEYLQPMVNCDLTSQYMSTIWCSGQKASKCLEQHKVKGRIDQLSLRDLLMWRGVCSKFLYQLSSLHMCISKFKEYSSSITGSYCCFLALCFGDYKYTKMKEEKCWLRIKSKVICIQHSLPRFYW